MAIYTNLGLAGAPATAWFTIEPDAATVFTSTLVILPNLDPENTVTRVNGTGLTLAADGQTPLGGTITSIERVGSDGTVYETITGLNLPLTSVASNQPFFTIVMAGNDQLVGAAGPDFLVGGAGNDSYYVDSPDDFLAEDPGAGIDTIYTTTDQVSFAGEFEHIVYVGVGNASIQSQLGLLSITGGTGNDSILALETTEAQTFYGMAGNDTLEGAEGDDTLSGGDGNDVLIGGAGIDTAVYSGLPL